MFRDFGVVGRSLPIDVGSRGRRARQVALPAHRHTPTRSANPHTAATVGSGHGTPVGTAGGRGKRPDTATGPRVRSVDRGSIPGNRPVAGGSVYGRPETGRLIGPVPTLIRRGALKAVPALVRRGALKTVPTVLAGKG